MKNKLIPINSSRFSSEMQRKLREQNRTYFKETLEGVVDAALLYRAESERDDPAHRGRMSQRQDALLRAIQEAHRAWDERSMTNEFSDGMLKDE